MANAGRGGPSDRAREVAVSRPSEALTARLAVTGGTTVLLGVLFTSAMATARGWPTLVPASAVGAGLLAAVLIGGCAGLYPALRAARLSPTEALRTLGRRTGAVAPR